MLASVFNKSKPINYALIGVLITLFYFLYLFKDTYWVEYFSLILQKVGLYLLLAFSVFLVNFITRKNSLSRDNTYAMFLFTMFLVLFPTILVNTKIIVANFFLLLALRRLISLQSLITPKEKIFDASFWIFVASFFHFWCIIFILLVFISIVFHVSRDYRNWIIPFIAFFSASTLYVLTVLLFGNELFYDLYADIQTSFDFTYFENIYQNIALALFSSIALFFVVAQVAMLSAKPINLHSSYKKVIFSFLIGVAIYVLSANKNNSFLAFTFAPLAIMGANFIESQKVKWIRESILILIVLISLGLFFAQL